MVLGYPNATSEILTMASQNKQNVPDRSHAGTDNWSDTYLVGLSGDRIVIQCGGRATSGHWLYVVERLYPRLVDRWKDYLTAGMDGHAPTWSASQAED